MQTEAHKAHIAAMVSHNDCNECRADCERRMIRGNWQGYRFVAQYLAWARPRIEALRDDSVNQSPMAQRWHREFIEAMNRRINLKGRIVAKGRKHADGYQDRLMGYVNRQFGGFYADAAYLRQFARRGASTLQ